MERDIDLVSCLARDGLKRVEVSVITQNASLARKLERRAPSPKRYLIMIERLSKVWIPVRIMTFTLIPGLTDHEIEGILEPGKDAGAKKCDLDQFALTLRSFQAVSRLVGPSCDLA